MIYEIHNVTKSNVICVAKEAKTFFSRAIGLMFKGNLEEDTGLLIKFSSLLTSRSMHSFFMRFPIDLIFIDSDMKVVDLATLKPWRIYNPKEQCTWVLEVNEGTIKRKGIEIGDQLEFRESG